MRGSAAAALGAAVLVASSAGLAAERNPADAMLDRARAAVSTHRFRGVVRVTWWDSGGAHQHDVKVASSGGALRIAGRTVVADHGRAWIRTHAGWTTLWTDARDPGAPSIVAKYTVRSRPGPEIAGRSTRVVAIRRDGHVVERLAVDREVGFVLSRDVYDERANPTSSVRFVSLRDVEPTRGTTRDPATGSDAPRHESAPADAPRRLDGGFVLVGAQRVKDGTQLQYSDGVFTASVFTQDGGLDWSGLPSGGADVRYGSVRARWYRTSGGNVITWESRDRTLTCVTDAPASDQGDIVRSLSRSDDSTWSRVVHVVTAPFRWG